jgi:hypothetical protein
MPYEGGQRTGITLGGVSPRDFSGLWGDWSAATGIGFVGGNIINAWRDINALPVWQQIQQLYMGY